jgi:hypothetical protein
MVNDLGGSAQALFGKLVVQRRKGFARAHADGVPLSRIGKWFGISRQAVHQAIRARYVKSGRPRICNS